MSNPGREGIDSEGVEFRTTTTRAREQPAPRQQAYGWLLNLIIFLGVACVGMMFARSQGLRHFFTAEAMTEVAHRLGFWGPLAVLGAAIVMPLMFLPRWPLGMACGMIYGVAWGTILASVTSTVGAWVQFVIARHLLGPTAQRLKKKAVFRRVRISSEHAFTALLLVRLFPLSNFVATNLVAGSLRLSHGTYLLATFLGMLPTTLVFVSWGKLLKKPSPAFYVLAIGLVLGLVVITLIAQRRYFGGTLVSAGANDREVSPNAED